ncbi:MAG TPA: metallophosphoesterase [Thermoanaerobaculia bacterium]|nr:metallophosphoesterase [Thermoanaerobaculia bacterium]
MTVRTDPGLGRIRIPPRALATPAARAAFVALALALGGSGLARADSRVVAIGDIHGDLEAVTEILSRVGLVDESGSWSGGDAVLVQTGDFLDRGADVRGVMDLLRRLQEQAPASGGRVVVLLGNHEAMNLTGFYRDVNPEAYSSFVEEGSQERFEKSWQRHWSWQRRAARRAGRDLPDQGAERERFFANHPPGFLEYQEALEPEGRYGRWLRSLPMVAVVRDTLFLHGGLSEEYADWSLQRINDMAATEIGRYHRCREILLRDEVVVETTEPSDFILQGRLDLQRRIDRFTRAPQSLGDREREEMIFLRECLDYEKWLLVKEESPVWFRGYARGLADDETEALVDEVLGRFGVARVAVGHTPQSDARIGSRFDGKVALIDTGMLRRVYRGQPVALVIDGADAREVRLDGERDLPDGAVGADRPRESGFPTPTVVFRDTEDAPLPFADEDDIIEFLRTARVVEREEVSTGVNRPTKMLLELEGARAHAVFRTVDEQRERWQLPSRVVIANFRDSFRYEPAAYRLSRLIGLDAVPPAVERRVDGKLGSIQLWVNGAMTEKERQEEGLAPPRPLEWARQRAMRKLFDNLVANIDRNQGNILIEKESWRVWLIDHSRSFITRVHLIDPDGITWCEREVYERLKSLDEETIRVQLEGILDRFEIDALLQRWKLVAAALDQGIAERGEEGVLFDWDREEDSTGSP